MMNLRNIVLWLFIALIVFGLFNLFSNTSGERNTVDLTYSQFLDEVEAGSIKDVIIRGNNINGAFEDGRSFKTYAANDPDPIHFHPTDDDFAPIHRSLRLVGVLQLAARRHGLAAAAD